MPDAWLVRGGHVPFDFALLYADARRRVLASPKLAQYMDIILSDGYASDNDHLRWVINARVGEIEYWAKEIRDSVDSPKD